MAIARFVILRRAGAPPGIDAGNWLAMGHALLGDSVRSSSIVYPPVVPLLAVLTSSVVGTLNGVAGLAAVASLAPAVGTYAVLRSRDRGWLAAGLAGLLAVAGATGEAAAWGGYPQLFGLGLTVVFLAALGSALAGGRRRQWLLAGTVLALTLATSHFTALLAIAGAVVLTVFHRRSLRTVWPACLLLVLPCLPLLPLYVSLLDGLGSARPAPTLHAANLLSAVEGVYSDFRWFWRPAFLLALFTPLALVRAHRDEGLWRVTTSMVVAVVALIVITRERRLLYLLAPAAVLAVNLLVGSTPRSGARRLAIAVVAVALAGQTAIAVPRFADQRSYYAVLAPGTVAGMAWIEENTPIDAVIAVSPTADDWPFGWWVEGLARRRTISAAGFRWLNFPDERRRALLANRIFRSRFPDEEALRAAADAGADFVLVTTDWSGYTADGATRLRRLRPQAFVLENESVVILTTGG